MNEYQRAYKDGMLAAASICDEHTVMFLSKGYAGDNPIDSFAERFACGMCANAIRDKIDETKLGEKDRA